MTYETPQLVALTSAIKAIQGSGSVKPDSSKKDSGLIHEAVSTYADWEE
jgi:hypothetical protein